MIVFLIVFLVLFFLLLFPIKLKAKVIFDLLSNSGYISAFFFKIRVFLGKISLAPTKLILQTKKNLSCLYFFENKSNEDFSEMFFGNLIKCIRLNDLRFIGRFGLFANCLLTSLCCGSSMTVMGIMYAILNSNRGQIPSDIRLFPDYRHNTILICFTSSITINLLAIIRSFITTICLYSKRSQKNGN